MPPTPLLHRRLRPSLRVAAAALSLLATCAHAAAPCSGTGQMPATALAPPSLLGAADFQAGPCLTLVGQMARFTLVGRGDFAPELAELTADSLDLLELRVHEMEAIRTLRAIGRPGAAAAGAAQSLRQTGAALGGVVARPVESVVGLPAGMLRVFGRRAGRAGQQAAAAGNRAMEAFDDEAAPTATLRPGVPDEPASEPEPWWQRGGGMAMSLGKRWLGYSQARRTLGQRLGIDPYTQNPWLDAEMDRLAWAELAGRGGVGLSLGQIGGVAGIGLSQGTRIHRMVWAQAPDDVTRWNAARLSPVACSEAAQDAFLGNGRFSPTLQTQAVDALLALVPQQGCDRLLDAAAQVQREVEVRYVVDTLQLLVAARPRFPVRFEGIGDALVLRDGNERLWLSLPVDLLQWTPAVARFFDAPGFAEVADRQVLLGRRASPKARAALLARGWSVVEDALGPAREAQPLVERD